MGKIIINIEIEGAKWVCKSVGPQEWSVVIWRFIAASSVSSSVLSSSSWSLNEGFCCCCCCVVRSLEFGEEAKGKEGWWVRGC